METLVDDGMVIVDSFNPSPEQAALVRRLERFEAPFRNLSTTMGHSSGLIREQSPVWWGSGWAG